MSVKISQSAYRFAVSAVVLLLTAACGLAGEPTVIKASRVIQCGAGPHERPTVVTGVAITPDGRTIAAATDDHRVSIWDGTNGELKTELEGHTDWVHSVVLSHDGTVVASGAADRTLCLWNMAKQKPEFQIPACKNAIAAVSMHPNNQQLAVVGFSGEMEIVNTSTGQTSQKMDGPCVDIRTVAFSPNGGLMAAAGRNGKVRVWNVSDGHVQQEIATEGRRIRTLAFSPDSSRIAVAGDGQTVDIFDAATGESIMKLPARPAKIYSLVFLDSQHLATGGSDNRVAVWDLDSKETSSELVGHTGTVAALACDATGKVLVSGSYDTTLRIWNLADRQGPATAWRGAKSSR